MNNYTTFLEIKTDSKSYTANTVNYTITKFNLKFTIQQSDLTLFKVYIFI